MCLILFSEDSPILMKWVSSRPMAAKQKDKNPLNVSIFMVSATRNGASQKISFLQLLKMKNKNSSHISTSYPPYSFPPELCNLKGNS